MSWDNGLTELQYELADLYFRDERIRGVAAEAGIPQNVLDLDGAPIADWHNVLREAANRDKVAALVAIASDEYPSKSDMLNSALKKHQEGVGTFSSAMADFNRALAGNLRNIVISVVVAVISAWIMAGIDGFFLRREFVILLLFSVILFTPFALRATFTRFRISVGVVSFIVFSVLIMMGEAALFSEVAGGPSPDLADGETVEEITISTGEPESIKSIQLAELTSEQVRLKATARNTLTIKDKGVNAVVKVQENKWAAPFVFAQFDVIWDAKDPGFHRNYKGRILLKYQYICNGGQPEFRRIEERVSFRPGDDLRSWLVGFIQIPYLRDLDSDIRGKVQKILEDDNSLCDAKDAFKEERIVDKT